MEGMELQSSLSMSTVGRSRDKLHVVSCCAPTRAASRQEKDTFFG